jgi:hypothetical protein
MQHPLNNAYAAEAHALEALETALLELQRAMANLHEAESAYNQHESVAEPELGRLHMAVGVLLASSMYKLSTHAVTG